MLAMLYIWKMNEQYIQHVAKLIPFASKNKSLPSVAFAYHFEPPVDDNDQLGSFFVVIEIIANQALASQLIDLVIKTVGDVYYNQRYDSEPEDRFEKALKQVNSQIKQLLSSKKEAWQAKISAVIGIIKHDQLFIAQSGKAMAFLYRQAHTTTLTEQHDKKDDNAFSSILTGDLKPLDKLVIATPAVIQHFSLSELRQITVDNSPNSAINKLAKRIEPESNPERYAAIAVEITTPELAAQIPLSHEPDEIMVGQVPTLVNRTKDKANPIAKKSLVVAKNVADKTTEFTKQQLAPTAKSHVKKWWNALFTNLINPNPKRAGAILVGLVVLLIVGLVALGSLSPNQAQVEKLYSQAKNLQVAGVKALNGNDHKLATQKFDQAKDNLDKIAKLMPDHKQIDKIIKKIDHNNTSFDDFLTTIISQIDQAQLINRPNTKQIADLAQIHDADFRYIVTIDATIYCVDTRNGRIYSINQNDNDPIEIADDPAIKNVVDITPSYNGDSLFLLTNQPKVLNLRLSTDNLSSLVTTDSNWQKGTQIASYLNNIYILVPTNKQVYKYSPIGNKFGEATEYLHDPSDELGSSTGLAINGNVFVGQKNNQIDYFEHGYKQDLAITNLDLVQGGLGKLFWDDNSSQLYSLTADHTRIIQMNFTGTPALKQQILPHGLDTLDSISIENKNIFALSKNKIYQITP